MKHAIVVHLLTLVFVLSPPNRGLRGEDDSAAALVTKFAATHDVLRGKSFKVKVESVLAGDTTPSRFIFEQEEIDFLHADDRVKATIKQRHYDLNTLKLGKWEVFEQHGDFKQNMHFPRASPESKRIRINPIVMHRAVRNFGDLLNEFPYALPAIYGYVDFGPGLTIEESLRQFGVGQPAKVEREGRSYWKISAFSKWGSDTALFDPRRGNAFYKFERVKESDSVVSEPNVTSKRTSESKVKDIVSTTEHPIYPTGTCRRIVHSLTATAYAVYEGQPYISAFVLTERKELTNGKHYTFTHTFSIDDVRKADPANFAIDTEIPDGTHVNRQDQKGKPIDYEWKHGEVVKAYDGTFENGFQARFVRGGLWSWGAAALLAIAATVGIAALRLRRRKCFAGG